MNNTPQYLKLHSCCHLIKGACRTLILDSQRQEYFFVPNSLQTFIEFVSEREFSIALMELDEEDKTVAEDYLHFLLDNELAFYCDSLEELISFPKMDRHWDYPATITNAVFEINHPEQVTPILKSIGELYIPCIQLIIYFDIEDLQDLEKVIKRMNEANNKTLQIILRNNPGFSLEDLRRFSTLNPKIELIIVFHSPENKLQKLNHTTIILSSQSGYGAHYCGVVQKEYFNLELDHYTESLAHNSCLNRKIGVDVNGDIKNCPSMKEHFGNVRDTTFADVLNKPEFHKYWNITKDAINKCKDCEFRHICTDCRAFIDVPEDIYSAPLKCGYNPYTCKWEEWSTNPLKEKAINYYELKGLNL